MSFYDELKRRNVIRVGIAYAAVVWLLAQIADLAFGAFGAPDWALRALLIALTVGFPIALVIAWVYELTPEGVRVDEDGVSDAAPGAERGFDRIIIVVLAAAITILLVERFYISQAVTVAETQSIAVLPFANMSDDSDHFADGLSEVLMNLLARNVDLKVAGRTSSFAFKGREEDLREIGRSLGVEHLLEGSVRRSGNRLRITAQLVKADDGFHVWSETYDRAIADVFDIQDEVAAAISNELKLRLSPHSTRITENAEAYALYVQAVAMSVFADGVISEAIALLNRALELDPGFAKAYELKAMAYWQAAGWTMGNAEAQELVHDAATNALRLDPDLPVSRAYAIAADPGNRDWVKYIDAFEAAVRAEPGNVRVLDTLSTAYLLTGYFRESLATGERVLELEPLSALGYARIGYAQSALGNRTEARAAWARSVEMGGWDSAGMITFDYLLAGDLENAIAWEERFESLIGGDVAGVRPMLEAAADPKNGKAFLDTYVATESAAAAAQGNNVSTFGAYSWYLVFGYVDDAWAAIQRDRDTSETTWLDSEPINYFGVVFPGTGFTSHPNFIEQSLVDLWEMRGKPDMCDKIDGQWTCQ